MRPLTLSRFFRGVPSTVRYVIEDAKRGGSGPHARSYRDAGWHFANLVTSSEPDAFDETEWQQEVGKLLDAIGRDDDAAIIAWCVEYYPRVMALIPRRRREQFLRGIYEASEEGRIEF